MQDPRPDADDATSEGSSSSRLRADGRSSATRCWSAARSPSSAPGGARHDQPDDDRDHRRRASRSAGDRAPPSLPTVDRRRAAACRRRHVIEDDATGDVETSGVVRPGQRRDRLLREPRGHARPGQRCRRRSARRTASARSRCVGDDGANASVRTARGGIVIRPTDFNPERIHPRRRDHRDATPAGRTSATTSPAASSGVLDYSFGNFKLLITARARRASTGGLAREVTTRPRRERARGRDLQRREPRPGRRRRRSSPRSPARSSTTCARPTSSRSRRSRTTTAPTNDGDRRRDR